MQQTRSLDCLTTSSYRQVCNRARVSSGLSMRLGLGASAAGGLMGTSGGKGVEGGCSHGSSPSPVIRHLAPDDGRSARYVDRPGGLSDRTGQRPRRCDVVIADDVRGASLFSIERFMGPRQRRSVRAAPSGFASTRVSPWPTRLNRRRCTGTVRANPNRFPRQHGSVRASPELAIRALKRLH